jgi:hypothetical protein
MSGIGGSSCGPEVFVHLDVLDDLLLQTHGTEGQFDRSSLLNHVLARR